MSFSLANITFTNHRLPVSFRQVGLVIRWRGGGRGKGTRLESDECDQAFCSKPCIGGLNVPDASSTIKDEAHRIVDQLPENASWEDLVYRIYVRQSIEAGLRDAEAGRVESVADVRRSFGLPE